MFKHICSALVVFIFSGCAGDSSGNLDYEALSKETLTCNPPASAEVQPWGESGLSRICIIRSGAFVAAESGYVHLRGQYEAGSKAGIWRWYDEKGNIVKEVDYDRRSEE